MGSQWLFLIVQLIKNPAFARGKNKRRMVWQRILRMLNLRITSELPVRELDS